MDTLKLKKACLLVLVCFPFWANAIEFEFNPKYVGELHLGYTTTKKVNGYNTYTAYGSFGTLQGCSINQYLEVSLGVDAAMYTHYYRGQGLRFAMLTYADMRGFYPVTEKFSPFINLALGGGFMVRPFGGGNFYCEFGPGIKYRKFNLSCGLANIGTGKGTSHFFVKTGLYF